MALAGSSPTNSATSPGGRLLFLTNRATSPAISNRIFSAVAFPSNIFAPINPFYRKAIYCLMLKPLFKGKGTMAVAALMSGSGSNLERIIEKEGSYKVVCILTDNPDSRAREIAQNHGIPYEENDIKEYYRKKGKPKKDLTFRAAFDEISVSKLKKYKPDVVAYCGYMSIASPVLVKAFLGVNVHPADL